MNNNNFNLVVLHHEEVFETRELAMQYLEDFYKPNSLDAEPVVVKYGDANKPNVILAFGTSDNAPRNFYAIDMTKAIERINEIEENIDGNNEEIQYLREILEGVVAASGLTLDENKIRDKITYEPDSRDEVIGDATTIAEAIDLLSKYAQNGINNSAFSVEDTKSVELDLSDSNNGKVLKANVKVSTDGDSDNLAFNDNIIGVKEDGIYAASNLTYDDVRHELIFTTSGYKNGRFLDDAIVQRVELGEHIDVEGGETDTLVTLVNQRGNIATITGNVKLGSTNSIVVRNGGLEANISVDVDVTTNKLIVTVGNQTITKQLPGIELFESAEYDDANEALIITFRTGNTLSIPIHGLIHTWDTNNIETSPIVLTKTVVTGGVDKLSGNIKLRSTDNLIGVENGKLYVSGQNIDNKIATETTRATNVENELRTSLEGLSSTVNGLSTDLATLETTVGNISDNVEEIATLRNTLNQEITERTNKDTELEGAINSVATSVTTENNRAETAEGVLQNNIDTLQETLNNRIAHDISDVNAAIASEAATARAAESANATRLDQLEQVVGTGSEQTLADAKAYTDTKITAEKTEREAKDVELNTKIETAVRDASDDATEKATAAKNEANEYTDAQVLAEKQRAEAAESANASAISDLATEVDNKIESVEIVKNSQSDLQYTLKVDGQDVGEINIPKDQFLKSVTYDSGNKQLIFVFETTQGTVTTNVSVDDLVDTYTAGNGLTLTDNVFTVKINEDSEEYLTVSDEGIKLLGIDAALAAKANAADVYTKDEIDNKGFLTEQNISGLATTASVEAVEDMAEDNATAIQELETELDDMKFVTNETDTVRMTMVKETGAETRVLSSDVKLKTISGQNANIIKSDANGLYATVSLSYNKAANEITFNDGNGDKVFQLNNFGILQDAFYDGENQNIVLIVKKDDETTERITIPVSDLVNTWTVQNSASSPVVLTKTQGADGDVLSADISILNNENNLLKNNNGSLFVDADSNSHIALWGDEVISVQGAINILRDGFNEIQDIKEAIEELQEDNENIKDALAEYQNDLNDQKERITNNENKIADLEEGLDNLAETVDGFSERIEQAENAANEAAEAVNTIMENLGGDGSQLIERIERIEQILEQLIDFGEYDIQL